MTVINATLLGQFITFAILVWFTLKYVWPPIIKAIHDRQTVIADGLAAAARGVHELELAKHKAVEILRDARIQAGEILEQANQRAARIIEESKTRSREEGEKLIEVARVEIAQEMLTAKQELKEKIAHLVVSGTARILQRDIDAIQDEQLLKQLVEEI